MTPKTAPCFVHSGWYQVSTPMIFPAPASILSTTQTPFFCRAVRFHSLRKTDYLLLRKFIVTFRFHPLIGIQSSANFILTCQACPRSLAYDYSWFCFWKFTKPADELHLQVLPSLSKLSLLLFIGT